MRRAGGRSRGGMGLGSGAGPDRAVAAATAGKGETRLTDETRDADDVGADVEITPEMIEAGMRVYRNWLEDPGDHYLTDDLVCDIHLAMRAAAHELIFDEKQSGHD